MSGENGLDVSRETMERLTIYADLLKRWNSRINLVSRNTMDDLWLRHIHDSAQIYDLAPHPVFHWVDLGSGAGFPGLVNAIIAMEKQTPHQVTLVESDARKSAFLRTVIRETGAPATVITGRIEELDPLSADLLSARALATLSKLLEFTLRHLAQGGTALFQKGASWENELSDAKSQWNFEYEVANSRTEAGPVILTISGVSRV